MKTSHPLVNGAEQRPVEQATNQITLRRFKPWSLGCAFLKAG